MKITIYSTTTCPYCKMLKSYLEGKNISYEEKLVDQSEEAKNEMMGISGGYLGVPFSIIENDNGEKITVVGFDQNLIEKTIGTSN